MNETEYGVCETCLDEKPESDLVDGVCSTCREAAAVDAGEPAAAEPDPAAELLAVRAEVERLRSTLKTARRAMVREVRELRHPRAGKVEYDSAVRLCAAYEAIDEVLVPRAAEIHRRAEAAPGSPPAEGGER